MCPEVGRGGLEEAEGWTLRGDRKRKVSIKGEGRVDRSDQRVLLSNVLLVEGRVAVVIKKRDLVILSRQRS